MRTLNNKGISIIEYAILFIIVMGAFLLMREYIQRGVHHQWNKTGQSFAFGRQYDAQKTIECGFDGTLNQWYDRNCYQYHLEKCAGDATCEESILATKKCESSSCQQLNNGAAL